MMKYGIGISVILFALAYMQANSASNQKGSPTIGLQVGQKAPAFAVQDQFGHDQSIETLKGAKGTVLLFFRSADW
jgi:hypothetical protein